MSQKESYERLPDSELLVMQIIWHSKKEIGTGRIVELVCEQKNWSRSTVQVLLTRLEERGFVKIIKKGRFNYYVPLIEEEEYLSKETKTFVEQFYGNSYKKLIAALVQNQDFTDTDMNDMIRIIKEAKEDGENE